MFNKVQYQVTKRALEYLLANAELTPLERHEAERACNNMGALIRGDMILDPWTIDDVKSLIDDDDVAEHGDVLITDNEAREALLLAGDDNFQADIGINFDVLRENLDIVRERAQQSTES